MPSTTSYVAAIALFGLTATADAVADLLAGATGIWTSLGAVAGLVVLIGVGAALLGDEQSMGAPDSRFRRLGGIGGALLYTTATVVKLLT